MRSKQYFTSIKNNPHEISTDPSFHLRFLYQTYTSKHSKLLSTHTEGQSIKHIITFSGKKSIILQLKRNSLFEKLQSVSEKSL